MKKNALLFLLFLFIFSRSFAQLFHASMVYGNNPYSIDWKYYDSEAVKVIFPDGMEKEASRIANIINHIHDLQGLTVGDKRKHLDLLLQTNQVISNGYVALAPYRSEFYGTGIQNFNQLGSLNWIEGLAFHEYRHALQFRNSRSGLTSLSYYFAGESGWSLLQSLSVPNWYMEGDAVHTETVFTGAGRGRTPFYFQEQRAILSADRNYTYIKARNGSFKNLVPDHYRLGYAMIRQVRNDNNPEVWKKILRDAGAYKGLFYPFSRAMKRHTGYTSRQTYYRTYDTLRTSWNKEKNTLNLTSIEPITNKSKREVSNYEWPHYLEDGSIICRKISYDRTQQIVHLVDGKEKVIANMGIAVTESYLSVKDDMASWTEKTTHPRWLNRNYSDIRMLDLKTGERTRVTTKTKLFSPEYNREKNQIIAVKADQLMKNKIVIIDPNSGKEVDSVPNPDNDFLSYPKWAEQGKAVVFLAKKGHYIVMSKYIIETGEIIELTPSSQQVIGALQVLNDRVYFTASYSGINNVYTVKLNGEKRIKQLTSVSVGANNPFVSKDGKKLIFSQMQYNGYGLYSQEINTEQAKEVIVEEPVDQHFYQVVTTSVEKNIYEELPSEVYEAKDYDSPVPSPKLHSWGISGDQTKVEARVRINNILNDIGMAASVGQNLNENSPFFTINLDYARWYVPLSVNSLINSRQLIEPQNFIDTGISEVNVTGFTEAIYGGGASLPLEWMHGIYNTTLRFYANAAAISTTNFSLNDSSFDNSFNLTVIEGGFRFANLRQKALRNIIPRFGQTLTTYYGSSVSGNSAEKIQAQLDVYLPGFLHNHGFELEAGYNREKMTNDYRFFDNFKHSRGYTPLQNDEEVVLSVNYALPLFYPDFGMAGLFYIKRVRANIFADFGTVKRIDLDETFDQNSQGVEVLFDVVYLNLIPLSAGFRYSNLSNIDYFNKQATSNVEFYFVGNF